MGILLNFKNEIEKDNICIDIEKNTMIISFSPEDNSPKAWANSALKRDRFNFCISYLLPPYIERYLAYASSFDVIKFNVNGYAIVLQFKRDIDFQIINLMFKTSNFPPRYFSFFFPESYRQEIFCDCDNYFEQNVVVTNFIEQDDQLPEYSNEKIQSLCDSIDEDKITKQVAEMEKAIQQLLVKDNKKENSQKNLKQSEDGPLPLDALECDDLIEVELTTDMNNDPSSTDEYDFPFVNEPPELLQDFSYKLLRKNIDNAEPIVIYATLARQFSIRQEMKKNSVLHKDAYDELLRIKNSFTLFEAKSTVPPITQAPPQPQYLFNTKWL